MFNRQLKKNIEAIDNEIGEITIGLASTESGQAYDHMIKKIEELTEIRNKLSNNKVNESYSKELLSGVIGIAGLMLVLKHEKTDVITTKAFSMLPKLFRGV